jgi:hypothetical protein
MVMCMIRRPVVRRVVHLTVALMFGAELNSAGAFSGRPAIAGRLIILLSATQTHLPPCGAG